MRRGGKKQQDGQAACRRNEDHISANQRHPSLALLAPFTLLHCPKTSCERFFQPLVRGRSSEARKGQGGRSLRRVRRCSSADNRCTAGRVSGFLLIIPGGSGTKNIIRKDPNLFNGHQAFDSDWTQTDSFASSSVLLVLFTCRRQRRRAFTRDFSAGRRDAVGEWHVQHAADTCRKLARSREEANQEHDCGLARYVP